MFILVSQQGDWNEIVGGEDELSLREYARLCKIKDPLIYSVSEAQFEKIRKKQGWIETVDLQYDGTKNEDPLYCTDSDMEMISQGMEQDCETLCDSLKEVSKSMKYYKGKSAKNLRKAIHDFMKERVKNKEFSIDEYDCVNVLMEKMKLTKYAKLYLRRSYKMN